MDIPHSTVRDEYQSGLASRVPRKWPVAPSCNLMALLRDPEVSREPSGEDVIAVKSLL